MGSNEEAALMQQPEPCAEEEEEEEEGRRRSDTSPRPYRDFTYTIIFTIFLLASVGIGIFAIVNHNPLYRLLDSHFYNSSSGLCYLPKDAYFGQSVRRRARYHESIYSSRPCSNLELRRTDASLPTVVLWTVVGTLVVSPLLILSFWFLLYAFAKQVVHACIPFFIFIPMLLNLLWFVDCVVNSECHEAFNLGGRIAVFVLVMLLCGMLAWSLWSKRGRIDVSITTVQLAAKALAKNWMLMIAIPGLSLVLLMCIISFGVLLFYAYMNGTILGNSASSLCYGQAATGCCYWKIDDWIMAYYVLAVVTGAWSFSTVSEAQAYIISDTVSSWCHAIQGSHSRRSVIGPWRHAFGSSFGTVCVSGLLLPFTRIVQYIAMMSCMANSRRSLCAVFILNKFTITFAAITGQNYCTSARWSYNLMKPLISSVRSTSTCLLTGIAFIVSITHAFLVFALLWTLTTMEGMAYFVAGLAFFILLILLISFCWILECIIDILYTHCILEKASSSGTVGEDEVVRMIACSF